MPSSHAAFRYEYPGLPSQLISEVEVISLDDSSMRNIYKGVWDTGATLTMITPKIFSELKLTQIDTVTVHGVNSLMKVPVVLINLILPNKIKVNNIRVSVSEIQGVDMLIGMDLILLGDFSISNLEQQTVFTYAIPPFPNRTDLYEKALAVNKRKK
jgi:predicted aspartyl protease